MRKDSDGDVGVKIITRRSERKGNLYGTTSGPSVKTSLEVSICVKQSACGEQTGSWSQVCRLKPSILHNARRQPHLTSYTTATTTYGDNLHALTNDGYARPPHCRLLPRHLARRFHPRRRRSGMAHRALPGRGDANIYRAYQGRAHATSSGPELRPHVFWVKFLCRWPDAHSPRPKQTADHPSARQLAQRLNSQRRLATPTSPRRTTTSISGRARQNAACTSKSAR